MIEVTHVSKRYGAVHALRDVSLRAEKGEILGLLGQNGAGKTTLMNLLTGYLAPSEGMVRIDGHDPLLEPAEAKRRLGYLPEHPPLYDEMTVREYLAFAAELKGAHRRDIPAHVDELMELTGLADMRDRRLANLSKGYRQRAGLAQSLCGDPDVLVLDEPTVGLDPKQITEIRTLIHRLGKGRTIVFSSHILSEVQQLCDHAVILQGGVVRLDKPMSELSDPEGGTLTVTIATGEQSVMSRLKALPGVSGAAILPGAMTGQLTVTLTFERKREPERELFALMAGLNIPILRMTRADDSLERIFLRVISENE